MVADMLAALFSAVMANINELLLFCAQALAFWLVSSLLLMELTFAHFGFVMRARELRNSGTISRARTPTLWYWCLLVLAIGLALDFLLNIYTEIGRAHV
jgi:hypothetical protein